MVPLKFSVIFLLAKSLLPFPNVLCSSPYHLILHYNGIIFSTPIALGLTTFCYNLLMLHSKYLLIFYLVNVSITQRICDFFQWIKFMCKECAKGLDSFFKKMFMAWRHNRFQILIFLIKIMVLSVHLPLSHIKASIRLIVQDTFLPWTIVEVHGKAIMDENMPKIHHLLMKM
jgi:hypothetical protein